MRAFARRSPFKFDCHIRRTPFEKAPFEDVLLIKRSLFRQCHLWVGAFSRAGPLLGGRFFTQALRKAGFILIRLLRKYDPY